MSNSAILEIKQRISGSSERADDCGVSSSAFACSDTVCFLLKVPRSLVSVSAEMTIWRDAYTNENDTPVRQIPLLPQPSEGDWDIYMLTLPLSRLGDGTCGLFYYHYTLQTHTVPILFPADADRQLLLYDDTYITPDWIKGGMIYHVFVDRFRRSGRCPVKPTAVLNPDWEDGVPQYGAYPGAEVSNNVFFGGDLYGITEKLDYIASLGVTCLYLSPVFDAYSNHKYDTGDYLSVDAMFGGDDALQTLIDAAKKRDIRVILDGVFNHTGTDSIYFNREGKYPSSGAYQSETSPYHDWYRFREFPDDYECWWGVKILPRVDCDVPSYRAFIFDQVVEKWMNMGISGWRLDVADELSDSFLQAFRKKVKEKNADAFIVGEVWEDASNKISYGGRRRYLWGQELDSVMNYPLRNAIISYVRDGNVRAFIDTVDTLYSHYPKQTADTLMNILGTHDTERILTVLAGDPAGERSNAELSHAKMSPEQRQKGTTLLKLAYTLLVSMPGIPCIFYGDEAGLEGYRDPFCRMPYPWKRQDADLLSFYQTMGSIRRHLPAFADGIYQTVYCDADFLCIRRRNTVQTVLTAVNRSASPHTLSAPHLTFIDAATQAKKLQSVTVPAMTARIFILQGEANSIRCTKEVSHDE